ncbi:MAG TPA: KEOPS complex subunit Cgi121 [Methanocorpusculum sp.]|nr:KEOPS complex subunit Cgi121 [Methanocorpusculum sp.]
MTMDIFSGTLEVEDVARTLKSVNAIGKETKSTIVLLDAAKIAGKEHIESAVLHAKRSFADGKNIARTLSMEILVYASGQRQCALAPRFGLHEGKNTVYVLILDGDVKTAKDKVKNIVTESAEISADTAALMQEFEISEEELSIVGMSRISELVMERVAMLDAWR